MKTPVTRLRRPLYASFPIVAVALTIAACGSEKLDAAQTGGTPSVSPDRCATPNDGCDCLEPGAVVDCGEVTNRSSDGFVQCSMGHRQCLGGTWGACIGEHDVKVKSFMAGGGLGTRALGAGAKCGADGGGPANPCDPYCSAFVDDPLGLALDGGLVVTPDGGLTIPPTGDAGDASAPGAFYATAGGVSACAPTGNNIVAATCVPGTPGALTACQQDFHCDAITSTCLWNGGAGYKDPLVVGGIDLTVGAPCGASGSAPATAPVCNRGDTLVPQGAPIHFWVTGGAAPDACTDLGAATHTFLLAAALLPGACTSFTLPNSNGAKYITINAGAPGAQPVNEAPGRCANNSAYWKNDVAPGCASCTSCDTQISGKVYDPTGAGVVSSTINNLPLPGIDVFQPSGTLLPLTDGLACDSCASLKSPFQNLTVTDASGSFTLSGISPGAAVPVVVQSGRWRRSVTVPVTACVNNTYAPGTFRMPRSSAEGNIPKIAVVTGVNESLACLLRKIGIAPAEIGGSAGAADPKRVELFRFNGMKTAAPVAPAASSLWNAATLNRYTAVIGDCTADGNNPTPNPADRAAVRAYVDAGGHFFGDHWGAAYTINSAEFPITSTWNMSLGTGAYPSLSAKGRIANSTPPETLLSNWLADPAVLGSTDYGAGWIRVDEARATARVPVAGAYQWIRGQMSNAWGTGSPPGPPTATPNYSLSYSFDTPFGGTCAGGGIGRVFYNDMHVNPARGSGTGLFPGACNFTLGLTPEEKALEFQIFQLTACAIGGSTPPPPPPPPPPLPVVNYERTYQAVCGTGERARWGPFYWESVIPPGTSIRFRAATSTTLAGLPAAPPAGAPTSATVGTANATVLAPTWDCTGCAANPTSVDSQLIADTGSESREFLRVYMQFNPTVSIAPTLLSWRQIYDCVPAE